MASVTVVVHEFEDVTIKVLEQEQVRIIVPVDEEDEGIFDFTFDDTFE